MFIQLSELRIDSFQARSLQQNSLMVQSVSLKIISHSLLVAHYFYFHIKIFHRSSEVIWYGFAASSFAHATRNNSILWLVLKFQNYMVLSLFSILYAFTDYFDVTSNFVNPFQSTLLYTTVNVINVQLSVFFLSSIVFNHKPRVNPRTLLKGFGLWKCFATA